MASQPEGLPTSKVASPIKTAADTALRLQAFLDIRESQLPWAARGAQLQAMLAAREGDSRTIGVGLAGHPSVGKETLLAKLLLLQRASARLMLRSISKVVIPALLASPDEEWLRVSADVRTTTPTALC